MFFYQQIWNKSIQAFLLFIYQAQFFVFLSLQVIDRRVREQNVFSEILPFNTKAADIIKKRCYKYVLSFFA